METENIEIFDQSLQKKELFSKISNVCYTEITDMLKKDKSLINVTDEHGKTPLHYAIIHEHFRAFSRLLTFKPDVNAIDDKKRTPLHWACDVDNLKIVERLLLHNIDINAIDEHGKTPLHWAVIRKNKEIVQILLENDANVNCTDDKNRTPLFYACSKDSLDIIELLLYHKADVNLGDEHGIMPLHLAVSKSNIMSINYLFMYNVDVNCVDNYKQTPLHWACNNEASKPVVSMLLDNGADMELTDENGRTPMHIAVQMENFDLVELLKDTDINIFDNNGNSIAHYAVKSLESSVIPDVMYDMSVFWKVTDHILLLKGAESYIDKRILDLINAENMSDYNKGQISFLESMYVEEAELLKKKVIIGSKLITSYDLLTMSIHNLTKYVNDKNIQRLFDSKDLDNNEYHRLIHRHYKLAVERCELLETIEPYFQTSVFSHLPFLCTDKIISYLTNRDLKRLINILKT